MLACYSGACTDIYVTDPGVYLVINCVPCPAGKLNLQSSWECTWPINNYNPAGDASIGWEFKVLQEPVGGSAAVTVADTQMQIVGNVACNQNYSITDEFSTASAPNIASCNLSCKNLMTNVEYQFKVRLIYGYGPLVTGTFTSTDSYDTNWVASDC